MTTIITQSGRTRELPTHLCATQPKYPGSLTIDNVAGLDSDGRIVVDQWGAREAAPGATPSPYLFGLTLCCNASDKGTEDGVVCRGCHSSRDIGNYLYTDSTGGFPGLDPIVCVLT